MRPMQVKGTLELIGMDLIGNYIELSTSVYSVPIYLPTYLRRYLPTYIIPEIHKPWISDNTYILIQNMYTYSSTPA